MRNPETLRPASGSDHRMEWQEAEFRRIAGQHRSVGHRACTTLLLLGFVALLQRYSDAEGRARAAIIGGGFTVIESCTYTASGRGTFSSADQFFANVVYGALVLDRWQGLDAVGLSQILGGSGGIGGLVSQLATATVVGPMNGLQLGRVLLGPATIWLLEIVQNYSLIMTFGRNTAWCYTGCHWGYCHGAIDLGMVHLWWILATVLEIAYPTIVVPAAAATTSYSDWLLSILATTTLAAGGLGLVTVPRFPPVPAVWPRGQLKTEGIALLDHRGFPISGKLSAIVELGYTRGSTDEERRTRLCFEFGPSPSMTRVAPPHTD